MHCPHCGDEHPAGASFCPKTGKPIPVEQNPPKNLYIGIAIFCTGLVLIGILVKSNTGGPKSSPSQAIQSTEMVPIKQGNTSNLTQQTEGSISPERTQPSTPAVAPVDLSINPIDGAEIVLIPEGQFLMGSDQAHDPYFWGAETPEHKVQLDSYWIDRTEVTQEMYRQCVDAGACPAPGHTDHPVAMQYGNTRFEDYPVVMVPWQAVLSYCQWAGGRLPTEAEWEKAARGTDGRLFPWGNDPSPNGRANFFTSSTTPVGSFPAGASPYGVYDIAGNVLEWVNDYFDPSYYQHSSLENPPGPASGTRRVIRGGAFTQEEIGGLRTVARASLKPGDTKISVGFRCAFDDPLSHP